MTFEWWTIPLVLEGVVLILTVAIMGMSTSTNVDTTERLAVQWFILGSFVCAMLAIGCWTVAG